MPANGFLQGAKGFATGLGEVAFGQVAMTHRFVVRVDMSRYDLGSWTKVSGLKVSWSKHVYRPGNNNDELVFPGNISYETVKLARAACSDSATVQDWLSTTSRHAKLLSGGISMLDHMGMPVITWNLRQFFPISWAVSDFDSSGARPAIETLELAHTGFLDDESGGTS
jgi:phage tail-like protein